MAYEKLDQALRQLKRDRERAEEIETAQRTAAEQARTRFSQIKSTVVGPIFDEVVARVVAEGFFAETIDEQNNPSGPISLNLNLSEDDGFCRKGSFQVRFDPNQSTCEFGKSTMAKTASTNQLIFGDRHFQLEELTEDLVREIAEQFVLDLIAGTLTH